MFLLYPHEFSESSLILDARNMHESCPTENETESYI